MNEKEKMEVVVVSLEGEAMLWYKWENDNTPITRWRDLKNLIIRYFRAEDETDLYE